MWTIYCANICSPVNLSLENVCLCIYWFYYSRYVFLLLLYYIQYSLFALLSISYPLDAATTQFPRYNNYSFI